MRPRAAKTSEASRSSVAPAARAESGPVRRESAASVETVRREPAPVVESARWSASPPRGSVPPAASSAIAGDEHEDIAHSFFSQPPHAPMIDVWDDDAVSAGLNRGARRARLATFAFLGVSLAAIGGFSAYHAWVMPEAVELGAATVADLPAMPAPATVAAIAPLVAAPLAEVVAPAAPVAAAPPPVAAPVELPSATPEPQLAAAVAPEPIAALPAAVGPAAGPGPSYDELISVGRQLSQSGRRNKDATEAYQRALELRPDAAEPLARLANFKLNAGDSIGAKAYAARAVISDPTNAEGWIVLGAAHQALGDNNASRIAYRKCAALGVGSYATECQRLAR